MQPDRFTIKSQEALQAAQRLSDERRNPQTTPEHLLAVLLEQDAGVVAPVLGKLGIGIAVVRQTLNPAIEALPRLSAPAGALRRGSASIAGFSVWRTTAMPMPSLPSTGATTPASCSSNTASRCSGVVCGLRRSSLSRWAACSASWDL